MPKHSKSPAQPDNTMIAYDNADDLSEEDSNLWDVYVSGRQSDNGNSGRFSIMYMFYCILDTVS